PARALEPSEQPRVRVLCSANRLAVSQPVGIALHIASASRKDPPAPQINSIHRLVISGTVLRQPGTACAIGTCHDNPTLGIEGVPRQEERRENMKRIGQAVVSFCLAITLCASATSPAVSGEVCRAEEPASTPVVSPAATLDLSQLNGVSGWTPQAMA